MIISTIIMAILAIIASIFAYQKGMFQTGMNTALVMVFQLIPLLIFAFILAGMLQHLLPKETLSRWIGESSGLRGIIVGSAAGACVMGGPYVTFPLATALLKSGANIPTMVSFMTGWAVWGVSRIPLEFGIMGWRFALIHLASVLVFPPLAGVIAYGILKFIK